MGGRRDGQDRYDGDALRRIRQAAGVHMGQLAAAAGCHYSHLAQFEIGRRRISPELANRFAIELTKLAGHTVEVAEFTRPPFRGEQAA
jgi:transcriptional regulator with XRE-family HTH domain